MMFDSTLREGALAIAREAAAEIMRVYDNASPEAFAIERKSDNSPLTAADLAAHRCIVEGLTRLAPEIPVLSEESAHEISTAQRRRWPQLWLVDPLDGTREFIKRNGEFTVNIALIEDGVAVFGVIQAPATGHLWWGALGEGAYRREGGHDIALKTRKPASPPLRVAGSRSHRDARTEALIAKLGSSDIVGVGSSLKFCKIAEAEVDVYPRFGPTSEWDTAAGQCIVEAAGGLVVDPKGRAFRYNQREDLLNGDFIAMGDPALPWRDWL